MSFRILHQPSRIIPALLIGGLIMWMAFQFRESLSFPESAYTFVGETKRVEMTPEKPVLQKFTAEQDYLERIRIIMGDTRLGFNERIVVTVLDETCMGMLRQSVRDYTSNEPRIFTDFDFEPIYASRGKTFCLSVTYFSDEKDRKDRPYIGASEGGVFQGHSYFDSGKNRRYENRSLQFRPSYGAPTLGARLETLEKRLSQYKPLFVKGMVIELGATVLVLSLAVLILVYRMKDDH